MQINKFSLRDVTPNRADVPRSIAVSRAENSEVPDLDACVVHCTDTDEFEASEPMSVLALTTPIEGPPTPSIQRVVAEVIDLCDERSMVFRPFCGAADRQLVL